MNIQPTAAPVAPKSDERIADVALAAAAAAPAASVAAERARNGAEPTRAQLDNAVKHINQSLTASGQGLEFSVDEDSKQTVVKIIDRSTKEVLRQMPTREALDIAKSLDKAMGKLINHSV